MTYLESLAKDCIENHTHRLVAKPTKQDIYLREESIYIAGYREAERRMKCCGNCEHGLNSAHEEPCSHCSRCFASADAKDQKNVSDKWEMIK